MAYYDRLSALDASFLGVEDDNTHMHMAAVLIFDGRPLATAHGGVDIGRIRAHIESRLHLIPRYRQRIARVPLESHPVWVDDARFNLDYHVRHTSLPRPGDLRLLKRLSGRVMSQQLDRGKPLWEIWVVEGLEDGKFALVSKTHHCMSDGISGVDLMALLLSPTPEPTVEPPPLWLPRPRPSGRELVLGEAWRRAAAPAALLRSAGRGIAAPVRAIESVRASVTGLLDILGSGLTPASETPLNPQVGPHRRFDWLRFDLAEVKEIRAQLGGTVNDVVLAIVAGAVRSFLLRRGVEVDDLEFRAAVPVSTRSDHHRGRLGNKVAVMLVPLPLGERDPGTRLRKVIETTSRLKRSKQRLGSEMVEGLSEWTVPSLLGQAIRLTGRLRTFNMIVTNVPAVPVPVYLLGAQLLEAYPMVPLFVNQAVGIALVSYAGSLSWGINADWDAVPDLDALAQALVGEFDGLRRLAERAATPPAAAAGI